MGKIFYLMGKSASGKDTLYKRLLEKCPALRAVALYTTRPIREGETDGVEYHFTTPEALKAYERAGKMIELRTYQTVCGPWSYATVDDGGIDLGASDYLAIGTLESYEKMRDYFGKGNVEPLYVTVDDGVRLERALQRERQQREPNYAELCCFALRPLGFVLLYLFQMKIFVNCYINLYLRCIVEIKRDLYLAAPISRKENGLVKVITGIRRCGKSYLAIHNCFRYLSFSDSPSPVFAFNNSSLFTGSVSL